MAESETGKGFDLVGTPRGAESSPAEPMTFSALILSLSTSALFHLGVPLGGPLAEALGAAQGPDPKVDLAMGKQTIEMLELLKAKTVGNLDAEEEQLLSQAIHDLKMRYVEVKRSQASGRSPADAKPA